MGRLTTQKYNTLDEWLVWQEELHPQTIDLGLDRIRQVYKRLFLDGVPFRVITVAGTNGKGSTIAYMDSIYQQSSLSVGSFTSPHLLEYNERFKINGNLASDKEICHAFEQIEYARGDVSLTYFEFSTLAALLIFAKEKVDVAILEIGLGGRLDSVNTIEPDLSIITNIDIDHTEYLGETRELIALEKAGIMRPYKPCVCGELNPPKSLIDHANKIHAQLHRIGAGNLGGNVIKGRVQKHNAAVAMRAVKLVRDLLPVTLEDIFSGVETAQILGRYQTLNHDNKTIILDVAHNVAAVEALSQNLAESSAPTIAIFAALKDKNIKGMIDKISNQIEHWFLIPLSVERGVPTNELSRHFEEGMLITNFKNINDALTKALSIDSIKRIVIFGSFHTVADATQILNKLNVSN
ncbi:folylpolyglutamate synthase/dihydrofolate synthase family protein [Candidatus Thioglobus sp.]|uniref:bifunctional folylpolyglutamate synthase/dihydrofolate synthase n=1 Tax=Candidatus Thioglobus sp. TaxID=2026721 RepID=UPI003242DD2B